MAKKKPIEILLKELIPLQASIAFVCSFCLGDTLIGLVTVNNFVRNGYKITVFGDYAHALKAWFPHLEIQPLVSVAQQQILQAYDVVLHMYESPLSKQVSEWHRQSITLSNSHYYKADMTMTDIQVTLCKYEFKLKAIQRINDIKPLPKLVHRAHANRIIIHPTSSLLRKNWPAKKFLQLAKALQAEGFDMHFIVSPSERPEWLWLEQAGMQLPSFDSLSDVAKFVYESGFFIGNDSGIGHLASNLNIATLSIILRKGVAKQWRPNLGEAPSKVVLSPTWLNPRPIKEKFWKVFTRVKTVKKAFDSLRQEIDTGVTE
jgi:heptosyltransferase III